MSKPEIGKNNWKQAINSIYDEIGLVQRILERLNSPQVTPSERHRLVAQASLALGRATISNRELECISEANKT